MSKFFCVDHKTTFSWIIVSASIQGVLSGSLYYRPNLFWEHVSATFYLLRLKDNLLEHVRVLIHIGTHLYVCTGICTCGHCFYYFLLLFTCYFQWNTNLTHSDFTCIEIDGRVFFYSERMLCEQALSLLQMCYKELGERNVFIKIITLVRLCCSNFWGTVPHHLLRDDWTAF